MKQYNNYTADDFTFVVCAYQECEYLEEAIRSVMDQTVKGKVLISTSTPNRYIQDIADRYDIPVRVNPDGGQIKDYNFAMAQPDTPLMMLMHQDEILVSTFLEKTLDGLNHAKDPIIAFTNYLEMHNDKIDEKPSTMVRIKRMLLWPSLIRSWQGTWIAKRGIQLLGNPINHPTVVCVRDKMPDPVFLEKYRSSMDWDLWERLSRQKGSFVYISDVLLYHRMNDDNQTAKLLKTTNARYEDELDIFCRFWPRWIAKLIMKFYSGAAKYY